MASGAAYFLNKTLGEDFMESLQKFELWKPGTKSTLDHEEIRTALQIVPRTVMSLLIRELIPMGISETKEIPLFVGGDAKLRATKHERDVYSGEIEQDNKKVVDFKFRSIPGVGLVIMSAFELYDMENLINAPTLPPTRLPDAEPAPILTAPTPVPNDDTYLKVQAMIDERLAMHDMVGKVVDNKLAHRDAVHNLLLHKLTEELKKEKDEHERARVQLAGAGVAALGYLKPGELQPGDYGHSASLDDVMRLKKEADESRKKLDQIAELPKINKDSTPQDNEYFRGMTNGAAVAAAVATGKEPEFVEAPKKKRPLADFLDSRKKKEYEIHLSKGETVDCSDCGKNIFDGKLFSGCICLGDDMERKVYIKKSEDGIKVRFSKGWDQENIEMLLEMLRRKHD